MNYPGGNMKKIIFFIAVFLIGTLFVSADIYIKEDTHTDSYYYGGVVTPEEDATVEIWFRGNELAYITANRKVIVDGNNNRISIVNLRNRTYVETSLPLGLKNILPPEIVPLLESRQVSGTIQETGEKKKIKNWGCVAYSTTISQPYALEIKNWSTVDVPFDWNNLNKLLSPIRRLGNYSESYIERLNQIKGFVVQRDVQFFLQGTSFGSCSRVIEISQKAPSAAVYAIPEGFQKNNQLTIQDLQNR